MKSYSTAGAAAVLLMASTAAQAISSGGELGRHYTRVGIGLGTDSPGLGLSGTWVDNDKQGTVTGMGLDYRIPLGPVMVAAGGRALYTSPNFSEDGLVLAVGGGASFTFFPMFSLYGDYYYSPDSLSSGLKNYTEASAGLRFTPIMLASVSLGYRYLMLEGRNSHRSRIADGIYLGGSVHF